MGDYIIERLGLQSREKPVWGPWVHLVEEDERKKPVVNVALVGKYVELHDAYLSVPRRSPPRRAGIRRGGQSPGFIPSSWKKAAVGSWWRAPKGCCARRLWTRGIEGKVQGARYARENKIPYLGLCLGMQLMVVEFARHILGTDDAND